MRQRHLSGFWLAGVLAVALGSTAAGQAQAPKAPPPAAPPAAANIEQPDAQRVREGLRRLLDGYPPALRTTLAADSALLTNQAYLAPYPALVNYLNVHPEIVRNPSFYVGETPPFRRQEPNRIHDTVDSILAALAAFVVLAVVVGLIAWLVRTIVDYRRWSRLAKVQTDAHTKLLDRFTANEDLLRYMQSPAGAKFLESSPIRLDASPRKAGAPLNRILWSVQAGVVLAALGMGLNFLSGRSGGEGAQVLQAFGVLAIAVGAGLVISAGAAYLISRRTGLLPHPAAADRMEAPAAGLSDERR
ncbi:MAG: hypothetical protein IT168_09655 [Bryobacterales bacterium]|nr:hypothetical protein [Bryobacterales bacterium]